MFIWFGATFVWALGRVRLGSVRRQQRALGAEPPLMLRRLDRSEFRAEISHPGALQPFDLGRYKGDNKLSLAQDSGLDKGPG